MIKEVTNKITVTPKAKVNKRWSKSASSDVKRKKKRKVAKKSRQVNRK